MARLTGADADIFVEKLKNAYKNKGYVFFEKGEYNLNIIGIRNKSGKADKFDDNINVVYKVDDAWVVDAYPATTEPGTNILRRPIVKGGTAILVPGQYRSVYKIDTHGGKRKYKAVCQRLGKVKIWRDDNYFTSRSMDVYIAKLRKYLKKDETVEILNIHGEGFRLVDKN